MVLLLVAEAPLVVFTVVTVLQNDRLQASDAVSRAVSAQTAALTQLTGVVRAAASIADAAASLPSEVLNNRQECDNVLATLVAADAGPVASIVVTDGAERTRCSTAGARPPQPLPQPAAGATQLCGDASTLCVARGRVSPDNAAVVVTLNPIANPGNGTVAVPLLWLRQNEAWLPAGAVPAGALPSSAAPLAETPTQPRRMLSRDGRPFLYSAARLPPGVGGVSDLLVAGSDIRNAATASTRTFVVRVAQLAGFFLAEFLLIASGVSLVASQPLKRLNVAVDRWRADEGFSGLAASDSPLEVWQLSQSFGHATASLNQRERELRSSIAQQELLMQEIHHRVKNNLQIIASMLNLQAARIKAPEARAEFQSARDRVRALATLHRHLYIQGDLHLIDMRAFFTELCGQLFQAFNEVAGDRIAIEIVAPDINISSDQAVPIALIVTETVGNALKYAFPDGRRGCIQVLFAVSDEAHATLTVRDDGVGLDNRPDADRTEGLGLQLVRGFARQLGAQLTISKDAGTCYHLAMAIQRNRTNAIAFGTATRSPAPV